MLGGSFDPPHVGHVLLAAYALAVGELDRLLVVPAFEHPLGKQSSAGYEHRFRMCELAVGDLRRIEVSRIEQELGGASRTLRTLEELERRLPDARLRLVVGADILPQTPQWHRWDRIREIAPPLVIGRAGYEPPEGCPVELPEVSSTEIRRRLAADRRTDGLVPIAVERYIDDNRLYTEEESE